MKPCDALDAMTDKVLSYRAKPKSERAYPAMRERLADMADNLRKKEREE